MWFFAAVLILWGSTATMASWDHWVLTPIVEWGWWTWHLYVCGIAAASGRYRTVAEKVLGLFGFCLFAVYYRTMAETYIEFVPVDVDHPELWPMLFLAVNLVGAAGPGYGRGAQPGRPAAGE